MMNDLVAVAEKMLTIYKDALFDIARNSHQGGEEYQLIAQQALEKIAKLYDD